MTPVHESLWQRLLFALGLRREVAAHEPLAIALCAHARDGKNRHVHVVRGEGFSYALDTADFFTLDGPTAALDHAAIAAARGRVLAAGAGAGRHSIVLAERGLESVAIDVSPRCAQLMRERGVEHAHAIDVFHIADAGLGPFDTILFGMQSIGIAGSRFGLEALLGQLAEQLAPGGQILLDSCALAGSAESEGGEVEVRFAFEGWLGEPFAWLYVGHAQLSEWTTALGWRCEKLASAPEGDYLARLTRP